MPGLFQVTAYDNKQLAAAGREPCSGRLASLPRGIDRMRIAMIGTGYVGLVSGACFSEFGLTVGCVDQDAAKIARLQQGEVPIFEPGLEALVATNMAAGRLSFTTDLAAAVAGAEAVFIAVGTPSRRGDGHAALSYVYAAAAAAGRARAAEPGACAVVVPN